MTVPAEHHGTAVREIVILGSTGSVGTQALDVVRAAPERFRVVGIAGGGARVELLARQALEHAVAVVAVSRATAAQDLQLALYAEAQRRGWSSGDYGLPKIVIGPESAAEVAAWPCDLVLNAMTGSIGLVPTLTALAEGRTLALANKESLVAGGPLVRAAAARSGARIVPVDSEHSALAQGLRAGAHGEVARLVLTASGGPFRGRTRDELRGVTAEQAMAHPTWNMGPMVTVNSATLINKGLEVIEAHELFDIDYERIDVVVHPQSVVHSMVEFTDGSTLAQASPPDMRLPIAVALGWPDRVPGAASACDWSTATSWTFEPLDSVAFPAVELAKEAGTRGGVAPAVLNAANEECVAAFLTGRLPFLAIVDTVAQVVAELGGGTDPGSQVNAQALTVEDVLTAETGARRRARELVAVGG